MYKTQSTAEFLQIDITYNENSEYHCLVNAVAFNEITLEWMVVSECGRIIRVSKGTGLAFKKVFDHCKEKHPDFKLGDFLLAVIVDWSDAEINGLKTAIGNITT